MPARARVEFVKLGKGDLVDGQAPNVIAEVVGTPAMLAVSTTVTTSGNRPVAPAGATHARILALDNPVVAAVGVASLSNGVAIPMNGVELLPVRTGQAISCVELTGAGVA